MSGEELLLRTIATLCATLVGALAAFRIQNSREEAKEKTDIRVKYGIIYTFAPDQCVGKSC